MAEDKEEVVDVENVDVEIVKKGEAEKPTSKPEQIRRKKGIPPKKKSKLNLIVISVVIIVILAASIFFVVSSTSGKLDILIVEYSDEYMDIIVHSPSTLGISNSGDASVHIEHEKNTVYTSTVRVNDGIAKPRIKYSDFVVANGVYEIYATFKGTTSKISTKELKFVPNEMNVLMYESDAKPENPTVQLIIEVTFWNNGSTKVPIESTGTLNYIIYHEGVQFTKGNRELKENTSNIISISPISGGPKIIAGNYTVSLNFTNKLVKDGTQCKTITANTSGYFNKEPYPILQVNGQDYIIGTTVHVTGDSVTVTFSASLSEDYDGEIVSYIWDFDLLVDSPNDDDDNKTNDVDATTPSTSHVYTYAGGHNQDIDGRYYQASVTLKDDKGAITVAVVNIRITLV